MIRSYTELMALPTYAERLAYLEVPGRVGDITFGNERLLNQRFYRSVEWRQIRQYVIDRDQTDLADPDVPIFEKPTIHHMNPMRPQDIIDGREHILDPEFLILVSPVTHNAIHYGSYAVKTEPTVRAPNDTIPWRTL